MLTPFVNRLSF